MATTLFTSTCAAPIKAEVIRVIHLDACGLPVTGSGTNQYAVFEAFTEVQNSPQYEDGQRYLQKKANGQPCVNQKDPSFLNWIEQTVNLCSLDPSVLSLVTSYSKIAAGPTTGVQFDDDLLDRRFSLELWTPVAGASACTSAGLQQYFYWAFLNMFDAKIQDFTFQNDVFSLGWKAISAPGNPLWGAQVLAAGMTLPWVPSNVNAVGNVHYLFNVTTSAPPTAFCGTQNVV